MILSENRLNINLSKYDTIDSSLIASKDFIRNFGLTEDYVEAHLYSNDGRLLDSNYNFKDYKIPASLQGTDITVTDQLTFSPGQYVEKLGYVVGTYRVEFNVLRKKIFNTNLPLFFIKQVSSDRTEILISSNDISSSDIESGTLNFINEMQTSAYYKDFLLNFGSNKLVNAVNIALDKNTEPYNILVKLYQPLPAEFGEKSSFSFAEEISTPIVYEVEIFPKIQEDPIPMLRSANFDINVDQNSVKPSDYHNINELLSNDSLTSYQKLMNSLNNKGVQINVDYSEYSNFIHFSSVKQRLLNFYYKIQTIENYNTDIANIKNIPNYNVSVNSSQSVYSIQNSIDNIIAKFDGYDYYLYYDSGSSSWPKSNSIPPYTLYNSTSSQVINWLGTDDYNSTLYGGQLESASFYDKNNPNNLVYTIPEFIYEDVTNEQYVLFLEMTGQHFDNIWLYIKSITDQHNASSDINKGISKDLVYYALRSLGIKLYNSKSNDNIFNYLIGTSVSGSYVPSGSAQDTLVSASSITVAGQDIQKETLKRIYHNLPLLLKSKGTARGIRALISTYGIPSTILDVTELGGSDKAAETIELTYDRFSYALYNSGSYTQVGWFPQYDYSTSTYNTNVPDTIELRFKPTKDTYYSTQSLIELVPTGSSVRNLSVTINADTVKGFPYSIVTTTVSGSNGPAKANLSLPLYHTSSNGDNIWWNLMVTRRNTTDLSNSGSAQYYDTFVKDRIGTRIGHQASSSIFISSSISSSYVYNQYVAPSYFYVVSSSYNYAWSNYSQDLFVGGQDPSTNFIGELQELRLWYTPVSEYTFNFHVLNPESIQGNDSGSYFSPLDYRFALGNDLYTYNHYLEPSSISVDTNYKLRLSAPNIAEHTASFINFYNSNSYVTNEEIYAANAPNSVYSNSVNQKVRIVNNYITGSVLSPFMRMEDKNEIYVTKDLNFVDASFSPQNEINKDIIAEFGNTIDLDELIGNPKDAYETTYKDLDSLKKQYFAKFIDKYNLKDFVRLIQFFDNSLFKMIEDFVPARTNLQTGLTIKSHILERSKAKVAHASITSNYNYHEAEITGSSITGDSIYSSGLGDGRDFYTGELKNSFINVHTDFEEKMYNKYIHFTSSLDTNKFEHSDFNTMLNNVSSSQISKLFKKINLYQKGLLESVEMQDSLYSDPRYTRPRYDGSKSTSQTYNVYNIGDRSYGKNAAIDRKSYKIAWVKNIPSQSLNFPDKTSISIKYLVDTDSNLTELSYANFNLNEVQNTFKSGTPIVLSISDIKSPSNQSTLDGTKEIWKGGFSYDPILFREANETMTFRHPEPVDYTIGYQGVKAYCNDSYRYYAFESNAAIGDITNAGPDNLSNIAGTLDNGSGGVYTYYVNGNLTPGKAMSYILYQTNNPWPYASNPGTSLSTHFTNRQPRGGLVGPMVYGFNLLNFNDTTTGYNTEPDHNTYKIQSNGSYYYKVPRTSTYTLKGQIPISFNLNDSVHFYHGNYYGEPSGVEFKIVGVVEKTTTPNNPQSWTFVANTKIDNSRGRFNISGDVNFDSNSNSVFVDTYGPDAKADFYCLLNDTVSLNSGEYVRFQFYLIAISNIFGYGPYGISQMFNFSINGSVEPAIRPLDKAYFEIFDSSVPIYTYNYDSTYGQIPPFFTAYPGHTNGLIFDSTAQSLFITDAVFQPVEPAKNYYSAVTDNFGVQPYDLFRIGSFDSPSAEYYEVRSVGIDAGRTYVLFDRIINTNFFNNAISFAILRPKPDETSVIINYKKQLGDVSQTILIPYDANDAIKANVGNVFKSLNTSI